MAEHSAARPTSWVRLAAALLALASLPLLWRYRPGGSADVEAREHELRHAEAVAAAGANPQLALRHLNAFLDRHAGTVDEPYARLLRARVRLDLLDREVAVSPVELKAAWDDLQPPPGMPAELGQGLRLRASNLARDTGATALAHEWYGRLGSEADLDKAVARAREGKRDEALALADHSVPPEAGDREARLALARGRILLEMGDAKAALDQLADHRLTRILRARALLALNRVWDAVEVAREAQSAAGDEEVRDEARYLEAEALRRAGSEEMEAPASQVIRGTRAWAPFGHLVLGRYYLAVRHPQALLHLAAWSEAMRSPRDPARARIDSPALAAEWRPLIRSASDPAEIDGWLRVLRDGRWLSPDAERSIDVSELLQRRGDPAGAGAEALKAARLPGIPSARRAELLRRGGDLLLQGGRFLDAAAAFRSLDADRTAEGRIGLFLEAAALTQAGQIRGPGASLEKLEEYLKEVPSSDPLVPRALLNRAGLLERVGDRAGALAELDRFFAWPGLPAGPRSVEWREAMRRQAGLLRELARLETKDRDARIERAKAVLAEWIDRYDRDGSGADPAERAAALLDLAQMLLEERSSAAADELEAALERALRAVHAGTTPSATLDGIGEGLLGVGRDDSALKAFDALARRAEDPAWRIAGFAGRATALHRLGRREEAEVDRDRARRLLEESASDLRSAGPARAEALDGLVRTMEREVR